MHHIVSARIVIDAGEHTILIEPRAASIRIKPRHGPEIYLPYAVAMDLGRALQECSLRAARARA